MARKSRARSRHKARRGRSRRVAAGLFAAGAVVRSGWGRFASGILIGLARPGQPPLDSCATTIHFGGSLKATPEQDSEIVVARDEPRTIVDLLQFARDFRLRARTAIVAANLPGIVLRSGRDTDTVATA